MIALVILTLLSAGAFDNDDVLEFYWEAATGNVHHYDMYVSINDGLFALVGNTSATPTEAAPYALPIRVVIGDKVVVMVQAVDAVGETGPMSEASEPVWRASPSNRSPRSE